MALLFGLGFVLQCGSGAATIFISTFEVTSDNPTTDATVTFTLSTTSTAGNLSWLVNETTDPPTTDDTGWIDTVPTDYTLTGEYGIRTLYAWLRVGSAIISPSESVQVQWGSPGMEDLINWDKKINRTTFGGPDYATRVGTDGSDNVYVLTMSALNEPSLVWNVMKFDSSGTESPNWDGELPALYLAGEIASSGGMFVTTGGDVYLNLVGANEVGNISGFDWLIKRLVGS